jgi:hypothetical protein
MMFLMLEVVVAVALADHVVSADLLHREHPQHPDPVLAGVELHHLAEEDHPVLVQLK